MIPRRYRLTAGLATMGTNTTGRGRAIRSITSATTTPVDFSDGTSRKPDAQGFRAPTGACECIEDLRE